MLNLATHSAATGATTAASAGFINTTALAASLPFIGAPLGLQLGGQSRTGQILGAAGGLIAGGIGAAFLAPSLFASTGALGSLGPAIAGLLTNPFTAIAAGALIVGAVLLGRNAARRRDENARTDIINQSFTALDALLAQAKAGSIGVTEAQAAFNQIRQNYVSQVSQLKDKKTRNIALKDVYRLDVYWPKIQAAAQGAEDAREFSSSFAPTFRKGGLFNSAIFAANGVMTLPGMFDGRDDINFRVSRGETVAVMTPMQFENIGGSRTFERAGVPMLDGPALATGGLHAPQSQGGDGGGQQQQIVVIVAVGDDQVEELARRYPHAILADKLVENLTVTGSGGVASHISRNLPRRR